VRALVRDVAADWPTGCTFGVRIEEDNGVV
jgi:hypothetical protein